jgi:hypothetical protein
MAYTSVERSKLQAAFGIAHKCSEDFNIPAPIRKKFRAIALYIWEGHGEPGAPPKRAGEILLDKGLLEQLAALSTEEASTGSAGQPKGEL